MATFSHCDPVGADSAVEAAIGQALEVLQLHEQQSRTQTLLRPTEARFERIIETLAMSVWLTRHRRILYANPAAAELLTMDRRQLLGVDLALLCVEGESATLITHFEQFERGATVLIHEDRLCCGDGTPLTLELCSVALNYGGESAVLSFGRDVTERKLADQGFLQADRLSALGLLAGGMAHALNNPLTYVVLNLEQINLQLPALAGDAGRIAETMTRLAMAREGSERMASVVRRVRHFARSEHAAPRALDFRALLESVVELVGYELHHRGHLITRFEGSPSVLASESKLEHICLGLLLFALQVVPDAPGAHHEVRLTLKAVERHVTVLEIVCGGFRIDSAEAARLLQPFAQQEAEGARGFGLSVCRSLIEEMGGHIVASCLPEAGLLLRVTLPCVETPCWLGSEQPSLPVVGVMSNSSGKARVLVIDDDPGVAQSLRLMLESEHEVRCLLDPREALKELLGDPGYDLVFCDLMMPKLSGMDLYQVLRFNRPGYESKMVFMTGGAATPAARRFLAQRNLQWLEKPFNLVDLASVLQRVVSHHNDKQSAH